jgi:hypothetical protein
LLNAHKKIYEYLATNVGKLSKNTTEIETSILIPGQKSHMIESFSVFVVKQLKETGLCSGITIVYVILCIEESKEKK